MKYMIRKGTQEHDDIAKTGLASMTEEKKEGTHLPISSSKN